MVIRWEADAAGLRLYRGERLVGVIPRDSLPGLILDLARALKG